MVVLRLPAAVVAKFFVAISPCTTPFLSRLSTLLRIVLRLANVCLSVCLCMNSRIQCIVDKWVYSTGTKPQIVAKCKLVFPFCQKSELSRMIEIQGCEYIKAANYDRLKITLSKCASFKNFKNSIEFKKINFRIPALKERVPFYLLQRNELPPESCS